MIGGFLIGAAVSAGAALIFHMVSARQREEYTKAIGKRDAEVLRLTRGKWYQEGYRGGRDDSCAAVVDYMAENKRLAEKVKKLARENAELRVKLADRETIIEVAG